MYLFPDMTGRRVNDQPLSLSRSWAALEGKKENCLMGNGAARRRIRIEGVQETDYTLPKRLLLSLPRVSWILGLSWFIL